MSSRLKDSGTQEVQKTKVNRRQRKQQIVAAVIAIILVGAMVFTLIPTFFM